MSPPQTSVFEIHSGLVLKGQLSLVKDVILTGTFEGDLQTLGRLTVAAGGVATGTIDAGGLVLEPGNRVEARVKVGTPPKTAGKAGRGEPGPLVSGWRRGIQKLKELAMGRA